MYLPTLQLNVISTSTECKCRICKDSYVGKRINATVDYFLIIARLEFYLFFFTKMVFYSFGNASYFLNVYIVEHLRNIYVCVIVYLSGNSLCYFLSL